MSMRATTSQRGYGGRHQQLRRALEPIVRAGLAVCARCGERIESGQEFDLGHDDLDRSRYTGPEHRYAADCPAGGNRSTNRAPRASQEW
jgi:hypothetical protein